MKAITLVLLPGLDGTGKLFEPLISNLADASLRNGQSFFRVHIFPFRMTDKNMNEHKYSEWHKFWKNLKEGYDFFEKNGHIPPNVKVKNKRYVFEPS